MSEERLRDAVAAGALASEESQAALLRSIVDVARAIFAARAASIMLLDEETGELVFEAVSGEGSEALVASHRLLVSQVASLFPRQKIIKSVAEGGP